MSYQGLILAITVGLAIGAAVYNYVTSTNANDYHGYGGNGRNNHNRYRRDEDVDVNYTFTPRTATAPKPRKRKAKEEDDCTICLAPRNRTSVTLSCGHVFHFHCIQTWFRQTINKSCPNCRQPVAPV